MLFFAMFRVKISGKTTFQPLKRAKISTAQPRFARSTKPAKKSKTLAYSTIFSENLHYFYIMNLINKGMFARIFILLAALCVSLSAGAQSNLYHKIKALGLIDIKELDPSILVELKYSTTDNFVGEDMYGDLEQALFEKRFAKRVAAAQQALKRRNPSLTLLIYDAARPISTQRRMRKVVDGTPYEQYVADGSKGGRHNYAVAVDVTIADAEGRALDMGAPFDCFEHVAHVKGSSDSDTSTRTMATYKAFANSLVAEGLITQKAAKNRLLLIEVMMEAGLLPYRCEWWHFEEPISMSQTREKYRLLDF